MRFFNTEGPVDGDENYCLPPLERIDLTSVLELIERGRYFVLHAPRQTGKTSCLLALMRHLNATGRYRCVYANLDAAQAYREDAAEANRIFVSRIIEGAKEYLNDTYPLSRETDILRSPGDAFSRLLYDWSRQDSRPVVLLFDEVDAVTGNSLVSLLRQLRAGYPNRPRAFPQSVILCGVRDIRDYRMRSSQDNEPITGLSAFNVKAASLRLGDFTQDDIRALYSQHTADTGQQFEDAAIGRAWELTRGQPWLVNALAEECTGKMPEMRDRTRPVTAALIDQASERLIQKQVTHIDQLADKLQEGRVKRVVEPLLAGKDLDEADRDDISYTIDFGLIRRGPDGLEIANPIYREVIPRYNGSSTPRATANNASSSH